MKDFARYIVKSINEDAAHKKVYQIAGDEVVSFRNFIALVLKIRKKRRMFLPVPPAIVKLMGKGFQKFQKVPLFTAEHVKGVLQDSNLDTSALKADLDFKPTPLEEALEYSLDIIGNNWDDYLKPRDEKIIRL